MQALFQIIFVRVDQYHIIHIPRIIFYPQFLFDQTVQPVQIVQGKPLAGLIAHGQTPPRFAFITVHNRLQQPFHVF